jgi:hypothetical protein
MTAPAPEWDDVRGQPSSSTNERGQRHGGASRRDDADERRGNDFAFGKSAIRGLWGLRHESPPTSSSGAPAGDGWWENAQLVVDVHPGGPIPRQQATIDLAGPHAEESETTVRMTVELELTPEAADRADAMRDNFRMVLRETLAGPCVKRWQDFAIPC